MENLILQNNGLIVKVHFKSSPENESELTYPEKDFSFEKEALKAQIHDEVLVCFESSKGDGFIKSDLASLKEELVYNKLNKLILNKSLDPNEIYVIIPPCLTFSNIEISKEEALEIRKLGYAPCCKGTSGKLYLDFLLLNVMQLLKVGIPFKNIKTVNIDTFENDEIFYSKKRGDEKYNLVEIF
ncbi:MAG: laccase domain-containing protein [Bacilli bacterium]|nr:laccase domain-containing protein [Bacilli bacterium]